MTNRIAAGKTKSRKNVNINICITPEMSRKLTKCAEIMGCSRVNIIEYGINDMWASLRERGLV